MAGFLEPGSGPDGRGCGCPPLRLADVLTTPPFLDIFSARTVLIPGLQGTTVLSAAASAQSFAHANFSSVVGLNTVGLTVQAGTILRLQDNLAPVNGGDNRGTAWYAAPVCVAYGFDTTFTYRMHTPSTTGGSDGMAFVIQSDPTANPVPMMLGSPDGAGNLAIGRRDGGPPTIVVPVMGGCVTAGFNFSHALSLTRGL